MSIKAEHLSDSVIQQIEVGLKQFGTNHGPWHVEAVKMLLGHAEYMRRLYHVQQRELVYAMTGRDECPSGLVECDICSEDDA